MQREVSWQVEVAIAPGRLDDFRALSIEMIEAARREPGTLAYERFVAEDGRTAQLYERYVSSEAAVAHLRAFSERFGDRWGAIIQRRRFVVLGPASAELRAMLAPFGATHFAGIDGRPY